MEYMKAQELYQLLEDWRIKMKAAMPKEPNPDYDPAIEKQLVETAMGK